MNDVNEFVSWWFRAGKAPESNRNVAVAAHAVRAAEDALLKALMHGYPLESEVMVFHSRGRCFIGRVVGWDKYGARVMVENLRTHKKSVWWAAQVQLANQVENDIGETAA